MLIFQDIERLASRGEGDRLRLWREVLHVVDFAWVNVLHVRMQLIPRYRNELGFVDIVVGGDKKIPLPSLPTTFLNDRQLS